MASLNPKTPTIPRSPAQAVARASPSGDQDPLLPAPPADSRPAKVGRTDGDRAASTPVEQTRGHVGSRASGEKAASPTPRVLIFVSESKRLSCLSPFHLLTGLLNSLPSSLNLSG